MITYFIKGDNAVKIGQTKELASRINALQTGHPSRLELLKVSSMAESAAHAIASRLATRQVGEWFAATNELLQWIDSIEDLREMMKEHTKAVPLRPEWADSKTIQRMFGVSRSSLYAMMERGQIRTSSLRGRGKIRGKRLFSVASVEALIESTASGPEMATMFEVV